MDNVVIDNNCLMGLEFKISFKVYVFYFSAITVYYLQCCPGYSDDGYQPDCSYRMYIFLFLGHRICSIMMVSVLGRTQDNKSD